ncbi:MAG: ThiF family adenylyltransferase [Chloroflexi bacterium]|nr:ThiF family adenylyltransferase [Chloroflexota bacterium]MCL5107573.1 ThiF family adenylyltransferase [Chloroflexota bacterium]
MNETSPQQALSPRYAKQVLFAPIGREGQVRLARSRAVIVGLGALGTVSAGQLARAGVGHLRLVDRDFVEVSNLQRQVLYDEEDAAQRLPKAVAAATKLRAANSEVAVEPIVADVTVRNVEGLLAGADVVIDGTDNWETRFLVNDACVKSGVPWVYGGAVGSWGCTMAIVPKKTPCLRCFLANPVPPGVGETCDTAGVLAAASGTVASLQCAQALRLLTGQPATAGVLYVDVWEGAFQEIALRRRDDCPACGERRFEFLAGERTSWTTVLCGRNSVQIVPAVEQTLPLSELARRLRLVGQVVYNGFLLSLEVEGYTLVVFPNGRTIVQGTTEESVARTLYARYVGG